jgi:hypothetical protein
MSEFVTHGECEKKMEKVSDALEDGKIRQTIMETKFNMVMKVLCFIAATSFTTTVSTVCSLFVK